MIGTDFANRKTITVAILFSSRNNSNSRDRFSNIYPLLELRVAILFSSRNNSNLTPERENVEKNCIVAILFSSRNNSNS